MPQQEPPFLMRMFSFFSLFIARCRHTNDNQHVSSSKNSGTYIGLLKYACMAMMRCQLLSWRKLISSLVWLWKDENFEVGEAYIPLVECLCLQHSRPSRPATLSGESDLETSFFWKGQVEPRFIFRKYCWQACTYNQPSLQVQLLVNRQRNVLRADNGLLQNLQLRILLCTMYKELITLAHKCLIFRWFQWCNDITN
jgi:hypothetical protein